MHNFTNSQPTIQFDEVHGMMGSPAGAMKTGDTCLTILYTESVNAAVALNTRKPFIARTRLAARAT